MVKSSNLIMLGLLGVGGYFIINSKFTAADTISPLKVQTISDPIVAKGYRVDNVIHSEDVGTTKILPIVNTKKERVKRYSRGTEKDVHAYENAATATEAIKASVKILPKNQADEQEANLKKLGW